MKPLTVFFVLLATLFGNEGRQVYEKHCASCHLVMLPLDPIERGKVEMKAPTMRMVAMRLKHMIHIKSGDEDVQRAVIVGFIRYYLERPEEDYAICQERMIEDYGVMPPVMGLTDTEKEAVAQWLYDRY